MAKTARVVDILVTTIIDAESNYEAAQQVATDFQERFGNELANAKYDWEVVEAVSMEVPSW